MRRLDPERWEVLEDGSYVRRATVTEQAAAPDDDAEASDGPAVIDATPGAVKLARERKLDLTTVEGTGAEGRITKADVEAAT